MGEQISGDEVLVLYEAEEPQNSKLGLNMTAQSVSCLRGSTQMENLDVTGPTPCLYLHYVYRSYLMGNSTPLVKARQSAMKWSLFMPGHDEPAMEPTTCMRANKSGEYLNERRCVEMHFHENDHNASKPT
jgi:hypothetical protein